MFQSDIQRLEKRVERLQEEKSQRNLEEIVILLDFNRDDNRNPNKVFLLAKIPPRSEWKSK